MKLFVYSSGKPVEVDSDEVKFCAYNTGRERMVASASLNSLLQRLTTVGYSGMTFINTFLTTLPLFTDTHTVMDHLVDSYEQCLKPSLTTTESVFALATCTCISVCHVCCMSVTCIFSVKKSESPRSQCGLFVNIKLKWPPLHNCSICKTATKEANNFWSLLCPEALDI